MYPLLNLRTSLACTLICLLFVTGLLTFTPRPSHASNNSLMRFSNPNINLTSEETGPQTKTVDEATRARVHEAYNKLPLRFEENWGQVDERVRYLARGSGSTLFLTPTEAVLTLRGSENKQEAAKDEAVPAPYSAIPARPLPSSISVVRMKLHGANRSPRISGENEIRARSNYFIGNNPQTWQTDVVQYERIRYEQVYPGIDLIYYGQEQNLEYDFEVAPGADP